MEMAIEFTWSGELIDFTYHRILEGCLTTPTLFNTVMAEKCQLVNQHFLNTRNHLKIAVNDSNTTAIIAFHDNNIADSLLNIFTITNMPDLKEQLIQLWLEVQQILKHYHEEDSRSEKASIESYYRNYEYKQRLSELDTYEFILSLL